MPPEKTKATIYDVAEYAGVAISTVSRVLNNSDDVSDLTRAKVLKAIEKLQFRPQRTAKTLAQKQSHLLAIALPTFTTPFHNELLKGVRNCLHDKAEDIDLLLCDLGSRAPYQRLLSFLNRGTVDALLLAGMPLDEKIEAELRALYAPVVLIGYQNEEFDSYFWDDQSGARVAVDHLTSMGHRRIGMIRAHTESDFQSGRVKGYRDALTAAGIAYDEGLIQTGTTTKHGGFSEEAGYEAMNALLKVDPSITAVFASSDVQAIGAWKALRDAGKKVPEDVALVGYDDIKTSDYIGLSSVDQSTDKVGQEAAELLLRRLDGNNSDYPSSVLIKPKLQVRYSSNFNRSSS